MSSAHGETIALFSPGLGALACLGLLVSRVGQHRVLFLSDTKHAPYGQRPAEEVKAIARDMLERLVRLPVSRILVCCNTTSRFLPDIIAESRWSRSEIDKIRTIVPPTIALLRALPTPSHVVLIGTPLMIDSQLYQQALSAEGDRFRYIENKTLAGLIDQGVPAEKLEQEVRAAADRIVKLSPEVTHVMLVCTHYALVKGYFMSALNEQLRRRVEVLSQEEALLSSEGIENIEGETSPEIEVWFTGIQKTSEEILRRHLPPHSRLAIKYLS